MKKQKDTFSVPKTESIVNGICFYSKRYKGYYALATIDEDGHIKTEWTNTKEKKQKLGFSMWMLIILVFGLWIFLIGTITAYLLLQSFIYALRFLTGALFISEFAKFLFVCYLDRKLDIAKFRYAEHLAVNAYTDLKRLPKPGELLKYPRFISNCSINNITSNLYPLLGVFGFTFISSNMKALIISAFLYMFFGFHFTNGGFNPLQMLSTQRCTVKELEVAVAGLKTWIENEYQEVSVG